MSFDEIFHDLIWGTLVKAALSRLFMAVPWLGWGPVGVIVGWIAGMVAEQIYDGLKLAVNMKVIAFHNDGLRRAYDDAAVKLHVIALGHGIESEEFRNAREAHKVALAAFVKFA